MESQANLYADLLQDLVDEVDKAWLPELRKAAKASKEVRADSLTSNIWSSLVKKLKSVMNRIFGSKTLAKKMEEHALKVSDIAVNQLITDLGKNRAQIETGIGTTSTLAESWIKTNKDLARDLTSTYVKGVEKVFKSAKENITMDELIDQISKRAKVTKSRAKLIATDQILTYYSRVEAEQQEKLGIEKYEWIAKLDGNTRGHHRKLHGKVFDVDKPPMGGGTLPKDRGHPGEGINCRCRRKPIL